MLSNILIATGFFGVGFFIGMFFAAGASLKRYKENPKEYIVIMQKLIDED